MLNCATYSGIVKVTFQCSYSHAGRRTEQEWYRVCEFTVGFTCLDVLMKTSMLQLELLLQCQYVYTNSSKTKSVHKISVRDFEGAGILNHCCSETGLSLTTSSTGIPCFVKCYSANVILEEYQMPWLYLLKHRIKLVFLVNGVAWLFFLRQLAKRKKEMKEAIRKKAWVDSSDKHT